jgi:amino acid adenylation domain-containing protein
MNVRGGGGDIREKRERLDPELSKRIRVHARAHGVTPAALFHAAWAQVLAQCCGRDDVVFGTVLSGRFQGSEGAERVLGMFINTLPVRFSLAGMSVQQLVADAHVRLSALLSHEQASLALAQRCSDVPASLPLFTSLLNYRHNGQRSAQEGNASPAPSGMRLMAGEERTNYPITLSVDDYGLDFGFKAQTSPELDPECLISYLETAVAELVDALEQMPQRQARNLSVLPPAERQQVLVGFNDTAADYPAECLIHQLFEDQVARQPDAIALVYEDRQLSYAELNRRANQVAHHLIGLGVRPDDRVAICAERSLEMIVGLLGILKAGGAYVPLDPAYPRDRLEYMLRDSAPVALLTLSALQGNLSPLRPDLPVVLLDGADTLLCNQPATNPDPAVLGLRFRHLAYVIYTSGSTGRPKGVMIEHRSVLRLVFDDTHVRVTNGDCVAHCANPAFDASTWEIWTTLLHGAKLLVISQADLLAPSAFSRVLEKENVSILHLTIGLFNQYADALAPQFRQLHYLLFGGEQSDVKVVESVLKNSPPQHLIHCYGPTETTTFASTLEVETIQPGQKLSIGRPIANTRIYILDAHLQPVPVCVTGEIHIGGAGVARGYLNRPELTAEKFISDPFSAAPQDRLYKTGDLGRWLPDGTIAYVGRNDFQVKIRGFRIELGEIEAKLVACDGVREAVVIAREDDPGDKRLVAYVLAEEGTVLSVPDLRAELASALPEYMVPGAFVALDQFPLTPNGKLDRRALPAPDQSAIATRAYEAPVGEVENAIARIWQELLGLERVGRHDHFFELGGHSLMIISMLEHLRKHGLHADVQTLYTSAALADLAAAVTAGAGQHVAPVPPNGITADTQVLTPDMLPLASLSQQEIDQIIDSVPGGVHNIQDIYPLAPLQEGILFHHLLETKGDAYLLRTVLAFDSRQHLDRFLQALQIVIDRHDILRSAVRWTGLAQPVQVVYRHAPLPVEEFVMAADDQHSAQQQLLALTDPRQTRLDLQQAPLIKPYIAKDPHSGEWLASLLNHHIVSDHITLELVMAEIQAILAGRADSLPASLPYRNFIAQARSVTESEHESYFRQQLGDITETTAPFDVMDVRGDGVHVRETRLTLDPGLAQRIRLRARQHGVTPAALFHAAWAQVLAQCCGRDDVVFGTILSGRLQGSEGADRVLGMFINTLPVRFSLAGLSVKQLVVDAHERLSALLSHEQASLALAQRCSNVPASLPLFTSLLNYRHSDGIISEQGAATTAVASEGMRILGGEERTNYPLTLSVDDLKQGFNLTALCVDGIDPARIAAYLHTAMERLVDALSQDPQRPVSAISILPAKEEHQLLVEFNDTAADYPRDQLIHQLFEAQAEQRADATALVFEKRSMSYGELNRRANRVAHHLIALGIQPDDRVAICVERSLEMVVGLLGILKAGGAYVPLDPAYPVDRLVYMLEDSAPVALLTQAALQDSVKLMKTTGPAVPVLLLDADNDASIPAYRTDTNPDPIALGLTSSNLAYIIYTSGSTGLPKGVVTQHQPVINLIEWVNNRFCVSQSDTLLFTTSLCFDLSVYDIFGILAAGGSVRIASSHDIADPRQLLRLLHDEAITFWDSAPAVFSQIVPFLNDRAPQKNKPCLRLAFFSGDWIPLDLPTAVRQEFPGCQVVSLGGATEATVWSNFYPVDHIDPQWASIPYGRPIQNARYYVLNAALAPCPIGVAGDLYIAGECLSAGYHKRPELTAERFLQDPFNVTQDGRMYKTGDRARYWDDGNLEFLGRSDTQVKIRGFRIELGEIEARLADCDGVRQAVVLAREDQPGDVRLVAYLVHDQPGHVPDALAFRAILRRTLPEYMLPAHFVSVPAIPLTPNGKIDRRALPAPDGRRDERGYVAPTTPAEELMTKIWAEALKIDRVGIHDNFFDMGGHSLLAMQVISRINAEFQRTVPLQRFFEAPTITELARVLSSTSPATAGDIAKPSRLVWD